MEQVPAEGLVPKLWEQCRPGGHDTANKESKDVSSLVFEQN